jgi:hypothetical protein
MTAEVEASLPGWMASSPAQVNWPSDVEGIELVWHRLNRSHDLRYFLQSAVRWAELDARMEPSGAVVASHTPGTHGDRLLADCLADIAAAGRAAKIDLKEGGPVLDGVLEAAHSVKIRGRDLWFNAAPEVIGGRKGFKLLARTYPRARITVPVDTFASWLLVAPGRALDVLSEISGWGVNRLSISVQTQAFQEVIGILAEQGWDTNIWDVSDPVQMKDAIASRPSSITADLGVIDPGAHVDRGDQPGASVDPGKVVGLQWTRLPARPQT